MNHPTRASSLGKQSALRLDRIAAALFAAAVAVLAFVTLGGALGK